MDTAPSPATRTCPFFILWDSSHVCSVQLTHMVTIMDLDKGSDEVLRQADALAHSYKAKLFVFHVLPEILAVRPLFPHLHLDDTLKAYNLEASVRDALLKRIRTVTDREPPKIEIEIEQGTVHAGILRAADSIEAGAVVVGGKVDHEGRHLLGSAAENVVLYANCPVLVARPSPAGKVLAATDFSDPALPALEAGAKEAQRRKADLTIIHALDLLPVMRPSYADFHGYDLSPMDLSGRMRTISGSKSLMSAYIALRPKAAGCIAMDRRRRPF